MGANILELFNQASFDVYAKMESSKRVKFARKIGYPHILNDDIRTQIQGLSLKTAAIGRLTFILIKWILNRHLEIDGPKIDTWGFLTVIKCSLSAVTND